MLLNGQEKIESERVELLVNVELQVSGSGKHIKRVGERQATSQQSADRQPPKKATKE